MSEELKKPERQEAIAPPESHELLSAKATPEHESTKSEKDPGQDAREAREAIAETVRSDTAPGPVEKLRQAENVPQDPSSRLVTRELKQITLQRELLHIRRKLPRPQRALSKVVHQPVVRAVSETAGKTVSRPSGLLGGGLVALVGTSGYLYLSHHRGFHYNYLVFLILFAGGFAVGLILELLVWLATHRRLED